MRSLLPITSRGTAHERDKANIGSQSATQRCAAASCRFREISKADQPCVYRRCRLGFTHQRIGCGDGDLTGGRVFGSVISDARTYVGYVLCQAEKGELEMELSRQKTEYTELQATITHSQQVTERLEAEVERLQTKLERTSEIRKTLEESELVNSSLHESLRRLTQEVVSLGRGQMRSRVCAHGSHARAPLFYPPIEPSINFPLVCLVCTSNDADRLMQTEGMKTEMMALKTQNTAIESAHGELIRRHGEIMQTHEESRRAMQNALTAAPLKGESLAAEVEKTQKLEEQAGVEAKAKEALEAQIEVLLADSRQAII